MSETPTAAPAPKRRRWPWITLAAVAVIAALLAAGGWWIVATPSGAQLVLGRVAGMLGKGAKIEGVEGRLGGRLKVRAIEIDRPDLFVHIDDVEIDSSPPFGGTLVVHRLAARNVEVRTATSKAAARVPLSFKPPYPVKLEDGRIGTLRVGRLGAPREGDVALRDVAVRGAGDARRWQVDEAAVTTAYGKATAAGTVENAPPFGVDLKGRFDGTLQERSLHVDVALGGTLESLQAGAQGTVAETRATAKAVLAPFSNAPLKSVTIDAAQVDLAHFAPRLPHTRMDIHATLEPQANGFAGPVRVVNAQPAPWDKGGFPFASASARVTGNAQEAQLNELAIALLGGGTAHGTAHVAASGVQASLRVSDLDLAALHGALQKTRVAGTVALQSAAGGQRFDVSLKDPRFEVQGKAGVANDRLEVETARISTGGGAVEGKGTMALKGARDFRFEGRAQHFDPSAFVNTKRGDLNFAFVATGNVADGVAGEAKLDLAASTYAGMPASGRIDIAGDARRIAKADVDVAIGDGRVSAKGSFGRAGDALDVVFKLPDLAAAARPFGIAAAGSAQGTAHLTGTFQSPAGTVDLTGTNLALPSNVFMRDLALHLQAGAAPDSPIEAKVVAHGVATGKETPPPPLADTVTVTLNGTRAAHRLDLEAVMSRDATMRAALQGGLDAKSAAFAWSGRVASFSLTGRGAFTLASPADLAVSASRVELGDAELRGDWGEVRLATTRWTPRSLDLKGATGGLQIQSVARSFRLATIPRSDLVVAGSWDIHATDTFDGTVDLHRVSGDLRAGDPPLALGLRELTIHADAVRGRLKATARIEGDRIGQLRGDGTALVARGAAGWELAAASPVDGHVVADIPDLASFAAWLGPDAKLGGHLSGDIAISGTGADPRVSGRVVAAKLVVREPQSGFEVTEGDLALRLAGRSLAIERFVAKTPWHPSDGARERMRDVAIPAEGGTISGEGAIDFGARTGSIRVKADRVPVTQLPKRFVALSGEATLEEGAAGLRAAGAFKVDAAWVGALAEAPPSVSDDVVVVRASQPAPAADARKEPMRIDLQIALNDRAWFQGRGLDARLTGDVHVTGEVGGPLRAAGTIRTVGGTYEGYGQKLEIERGVLTFSGPLDNPRLNVLALRKGLPVEAGVEILGTTTRPRVTLVSSPDVPEPEKLSWLVLGRGASDATPGDSAVLLAAASALLGNNNPGSDFSKRLGIDDVHIGRSDTSSNLGVLPQSTVAGRTGTPSAAEVVSVGKRLNRNLQLNYEQGLGDAEGTLKVTWRISRQFQVLVRAGYLPGLDAVYRWTFR